jgi:hypothetical protein
LGFPRKSAKTQNQLGGNFDSFFEWKDGWRNYVSPVLWRNRRKKFDRRAQVSKTGIA